MVLISGIEVEFPFPPYPCQVRYMKSVIEALNGNHNALLESPTGTGKTFAMLCSVLAWKRVQAKPTRVLFATRTHSQLAQVQKELSKLVQGVSTTVLSSREQLCIHPDVAPLHTAELQYQECTRLVQQKGCSFHAAMKNAESPPTHFVSDIEDFVQSCRSDGVCPYYTARKQALTSDLVLLPYNYLTNMKLRSLYTDIIKDSVIILDEAHNIAAYCEAGASFSLPLEHLHGPPLALTDLCAFLEEVADRSEDLFEHFPDVILPREIPPGALAEFVGRVTWVLEQGLQDRYHVMIQDGELTCACMDPSVSLGALRAVSGRSILVTSGTISPLSSLVKELGVEFRVVLQNGHVIQRDQLAVQIVSKGSDGQLLEASFKNRSTPAYLNSLGTTLTNYFRVIPGGILVFFPSYTLLNTAVEHWRGGGVWDSLKKHKSLVREPRFKDELQASIDRFRAGDAAFFAVCRGKLSEGIDLRDVSAVLIIGIPFSYMGDDMIKLKMEFLDNNGLSGREWYKQQAFRAVNQALGRAIRHKEDLGMVMLLDHRFARHTDLLPIWARESLSIPENFGHAIRDTVQFYRRHGYERNGGSGEWDEWVGVFLWLLSMILSVFCRGLRAVYKLCTK